MIRVERQPEPGDFDQRVRQKGLRALQELRGQRGLPPRSGRPREPKPDIKPDDLPPYWQQCLDDLHAAYRGVCAYSCFYIPPVTGNRTVDHFVARRSARLDDAYEWNNYRLAAGLMNSRKGVFHDVLDPFEVQDGWFQLEFFGFQLKPAPDLADALMSRIDESIERLGLNAYECRKYREKFFEDYEHRHISFEYLERHAPLVAMEMKRQGRVSHTGPLGADAGE